MQLTIQSIYSTKVPSMQEIIKIKAYVRNLTS